jgi:flagellar basal-body rod protein FlgG
MTSSLFHTLNISKQDMITRLADLDVVSSNLANVNTSGYKASRSNFQELLGRVIQRDGIKTASTQSLMQQGAIHQSANALDWAIQGDGFFQVKLKDGRTGYTRDGEFSLDRNRTLVTASGEKVIWNGQIPDGYTDISVRPDGTVEAAMPDGTRQICGTIQLARFANPTGLQGNGENLWLETVASGKPIVAAPSSANMGVINSHQVESSNVDLSREMTQMMIDQRTFQLSVKAFQQTDQMISQAINLRKG